MEWSGRTAERHRAALAHFGAYDQNIFTQWHSRYGGRGVLTYWHVERKSMAIHSQLISCTASDTLTVEDRRGLTPLFWTHVAPYGEVRLNMAKRLELRGDARTLTP
jgi:hypothetical protein